MNACNKRRYDWTLVSVIDVSIGEAAVACIVGSRRGIELRYSLGQFIFPAFLISGLLECSIHVPNELLQYWEWFLWNVATYSSLVIVILELSALCAVCKASYYFCVFLLFSCFRLPLHNQVSFLEIYINQFLSSAQVLSDCWFTLGVSTLRTPKYWFVYFPRVFDITFQWYLWMGSSVGCYFPKLLQSVCWVFSGDSARGLQPVIHTSLR